MGRVECGFRGFQNCFLLFLILLLSNYKADCQKNNEKKQELLFFVNYKTIKPIEIRKIIFYYSVTRKRIIKSDSIICDNLKEFSNDTIHIPLELNYPFYFKIRIDCSDLKRSSDEIYCNNGKNVWKLNILDTSLQVNAYAFRSIEKPLRPFILLILFLQLCIELIISFFISKLIGWPRRIIIMVVAANLAVFPIYFFSINSLYIREIFTLIIKTIIMVVIGYKKIHIRKIILFAIALTIIGFGLREILFVLLRFL